MEYWCAWLSGSAWRSPHKGMLRFSSLTLGSFSKLSRIISLRLFISILLRIFLSTCRCKYCQIFTPKFEQLAKINKIEGLNFGKLDGPAYKNLTEKYDIYSYPTIALFWRGIDAPIFYRKEREVTELLEFLKLSTKPIKNNLNKEQYEKLS